MVGGQQLSARGLHEVVDVDFQACGLDDTGIGPAIGFERQVATGDQRATGAHYIAHVDIEIADTHMGHVTARIEKA
ncbi:hypothetical protein D3C87_1284090 [compost metagenome]